MHVWVLLQPRHGVGCGVGREVVHHDVDLLTLVRLHGFLDESQEVRAVAGGFALAEDLAGAHIEGCEEVRGAVPDA